MAMETDHNHKRRSGFMKSLYKAAKPNEAKPNYPTAPNGYEDVKMQRNQSTPLVPLLEAVGL